MEIDLVMFSFAVLHPSKADLPLIPDLGYDEVAKQREFLNTNPPRAQRGRRTGDGGEGLGGGAGVGGGVRAGRVRERVARKRVGGRVGGRRLFDEVEEAFGALNAQGDTLLSEGVGGEGDELGEEAELVSSDPEKDEVTDTDSGMVSGESEEFVDGKTASENSEAESAERVIDDTNETGGVGDVELENVGKGLVDNANVEGDVVMAEGEIAVEKVIDGEVADQEVEHTEVADQEVEHTEVADQEVEDDSEDEETLSARGSRLKRKRSERDDVDAGEDVGAAAIKKARSIHEVGESSRGGARLRIGRMLRLKT